MGILDTYSNSNFGKTGGFGGGGSSGGGGGGGSIGGGNNSQYNSINEVRRAYDENKLTYSAAYRILMDQFGLSDLSIQDVLIIEPPQFDDDIPLDPGLADAIPDTNPQTQEAESETVPMTDDQRFLIIGLVVAAALFGFIKR
jgi:hypothetical protein